jgi:hypothetical protein
MMIPSGTQRVVQELCRALGPHLFHFLREVVEHATQEWHASQQAKVAHQIVAPPKETQRSIPNAAPRPSPVTNVVRPAEAPSTHIVLGNGEVRLNPLPEWQVSRDPSKLAFDLVITDGITNLTVLQVQLLPSLKTDALSWARERLGEFTTAGRLRSTDAGGHDLVNVKPITIGHQDYSAQLIDQHGSLATTGRMLVAVCAGDNHAVECHAWRYPATRLDAEAWAKPMAELLVSFRSFHSTH